eukprot:Tamp_06219.p1 GENE.Tamp_06219~~Tamp_06219.p1  ORF type:complete len:713 (-),score=106.40 Tamp_06219:116-2254(-)
MRLCGPRESTTPKSSSTCTRWTMPRSSCNARTLSPDRAVPGDALCGDTHTRLRQGCTVTPRPAAPCSRTHARARTHTHTHTHTHAHTHTRTQVMAHSMSKAKTEDECYAMVAKLLVALFGVARCSVALLTDDKKHCLGVQMAMLKKEMANVFHKDSSGFRFPLQGSVFGHISQTHEVYYNPDIQTSQHWDHQQAMREKGISSVVNAPLLAHGKFVGALSMVHPLPNHFSANDILLIKDIASSLTANLLLRRLQEAQRAELATVQNMLHALIPKKVLENIAHHWRDRFLADDKRCSSEQEGYCSTDGGLDYEEMEELEDAVAVLQTISCRADAHSSSDDGNNNLNVLPSAVVKRERERAAPAATLPEKQQRHKGGSGRSGKGLGTTRERGGHDADRGRGSDQESSDQECSDEDGHAPSAEEGQEGGRHREAGGAKGRARTRRAKALADGAADARGPLLQRIGRALYAEERKNVSIIFSDVVSFSRIADGAPAPKVMDMLHNLFHQYDMLCEKHDIFKVETIGDGCVMAAGLIDRDGEPKNDKANARRALAIAEDMIRAARKVRPPLNRHGERPPFIEIRVGIHQGDITCGVLGKLQPRFQVFGSAVNMAARMEQSGAASQVHVSQDFYELVDMPESYWHRQATVSVKNLGQVHTWYHDPLLFGRQPFQAESPRLSAREASEPEGVAGSGDGTITLHSMSYERSRALLKAGSDH